MEDRIEPGGYQVIDHASSLCPLPRQTRGSIPELDKGRMECEVVPGYDHHYHHHHHHRSASNSSVTQGQYTSHGLPYAARLAFSYAYLFAGPRYRPLETAGLRPSGRVEREIHVVEAERRKKRVVATSREGEAASCVAALCRLGWNPRVFRARGGGRKDPRIILEPPTSGDDGLFESTRRRSHQLANH
ncbi:hypothetical protein KM043_008319 [Ampulex compressa]|nr:hypothetical protein KM043_008319 [Ampulex compressa]